MFEAKLNFNGGHAIGTQNLCFNNTGITISLFLTSPPRKASKVRKIDDFRNLRSFPERKREDG